MFFRAFRTEGRQHEPAGTSVLRRKLTLLSVGRPGELLENQTCPN
jgi:hypothetical protein